ncbi:hypothetical protein [Dankookia sp. P2]|uniref:hypothetical protein n=1 Tax=Dankookia sp. P2 TaxID=3423955 RepID=UPI003D66423C
MQPFYWPCDEYSLGWSAVADKLPAVYDVPGNHATIIDVGRAPFLADALSRALEARQHPARQPRAPEAVLTSA